MSSQSDAFGGNNNNNQMKMKRKKRQDFSGLSVNERRAAKMANNRQAAQNLRDRKKEREHELEQQLHALNDNTAELARRFKQLEAENRAMQDEARAFADEQMQKLPELRGVSAELFQAVQRDQGNGFSVAAIMNALGAVLDGRGRPSSSSSTSTSSSTTATSNPASPQPNNNNANAMMMMMMLGATAGNNAPAVASMFAAPPPSQQQDPVMMMLSNGVMDDDCSGSSSPFNEGSSSTATLSPQYSNHSGASTAPTLDSFLDDIENDTTLDASGPFDSATILQDMMPPLPSDMLSALLPSPASLPLNLTLTNTNTLLNNEENPFLSMSVDDNNNNNNQQPISQPNNETKTNIAAAPVTTSVVVPGPLLQSSLSSSTNNSDSSSSSSSSQGIQEMEHDANTSQMSLSATGVVRPAVPPLPSGLHQLLMMIIYVCLARLPQFGSSNNNNNNNIPPQQQTLPLPLSQPVALPSTSTLAVLAHQRQAEKQRLDAAQRQSKASQQQEQSISQLSRPKLPGVTPSLTTLTSASLLSSPRHHSPASTLMPATAMVPPVPIATLSIPSFPLLDDVVPAIPMLIPLHQVQQPNQIVPLSPPTTTPSSSSKTSLLQQALTKSKISASLLTTSLSHLDPPQTLKQQSSSTKESTTTVTATEIETATVTVTKPTKPIKAVSSFGPKGFVLPLPESLRSPLALLSLLFPHQLQAAPAPPPTSTPPSTATAAAALTTPISCTTTTTTTSSSNSSSSSSNASLPPPPPLLPVVPQSKSTASTACPLKMLGGQQISALYYSKISPLLARLGYTGSSPTTTTTVPATPSFKSSLTCNRSCNSESGSAAAAVNPTTSSSVLVK